MKSNLKWALALWLAAASVSPCMAAVLVDQLKLTKLRDHVEHSGRAVGQVLSPPVRPE